MNTRTFEDLLDRHGADLARWPLELRGDATSLLAASAEARDLRAAMEAVEDVLGASSLAPAPAATTHKGPVSVPSGFAAVAMRRPQARRVSPLMQHARWGAAVAAALVLGVLVGTTRFETSEITPDQVVTSALESHGAVDVD